MTKEELILAKKRLEKLEKIHKWVLRFAVLFGIVGSIFNVLTLYYTISVVYCIILPLSISVMLGILSYFLLLEIYY